MWDKHSGRKITMFIHRENKNHKVDKKRKLAQEDKKIKENKYFKIKGSVNRYYKKRESDAKVLHNMMHWTNSTG